MTDKLILVLVFIGGIVLLVYRADKSKKKKIVFFGDSLTEHATLNKGYITLMKKMLDQLGIINYELICAGISGNKIYDLYLRMEEDVLGKSPHIVVVFIGVNDVWQKKTHNTGTDIDKFENFYRAIITKLKISAVKIVLCTPALIGEKKDGLNEQDEELNNYCNIIRNLAAELDLPLVDIRNAFIAYEEANNTDDKEKGLLTIDGVHLNSKGNQLVAELMWDVLKDVK